MRRSRLKTTQELLNYHFKYHKFDYDTREACVLHYTFKTPSGHIMGTKGVNYSIPVDPYIHQDTRNFAQTQLKKWLHRNYEI